MALECNDSGTIPVIDIINAVNENETNVSSNEARLNQNDLNIAGINTQITAIDARVDLLEASSPPSSGDFNALEGRVSTNENYIAQNESNISQFNVQLQNNISDINDLQVRVGVNENEILSLSSTVSGLSNEILQNIDPQLLDQDSRIQALESASTDSITLLCVHEEPEGVGAGTAVALTWTQRNIGQVKYDTVGGVSAPTSYTLPVGIYKIHAKCSGNSDYHQSRINVGSTSYYGSVAKGTDMSEIYEVLSIATNTNISIETKINSVGTGNELGEPSPWGTIGGTSGEKNRYVTLSIDKIG